MSKKILKKIIPATFDKIENENRKVVKQLEKAYDERTNSCFQKTENSIITVLRECINRAGDVIWKLDHNFPKIHKELNQISDQLKLIPQKYEYDNDYERKKNSMCLYYR